MSHGFFLIYKAEIVYFNSYDKYIRDREIHDLYEDKFLKIDM